MDKLDAKVGVGPEASRRPGEKPQCSLETNKHMDSHTTQTVWSWHAWGPRGALPVFLDIVDLQEAGCRQYKGTNAHMCSPTPVRMS